MRDEIRTKIIATYQGFFQALPDYGYDIADRLSNDILAVFQKRLDAIKSCAREIYTPNTFSGWKYKDIAFGAIIALCTLDEPAKPKIAVGQTWEKQPSCWMKVLMIHVDESGKEHIIVEQDQFSGIPHGNRNIVVMNRETFDNYRLIKDGDTNDG